MLDSRGQPIQSQPPDVRLTCQAVLNGDVLHLQFEVTNAAKEAIHVFDDRGRGDFKPSLLCDGGGSAVHVLWGVPQLPSDIRAYWRYYPKATKLIPGESVRREAKIAIPMRETDPYYPTRYESYRSVHVSRLTLRVDIVREGKLQPSQHPDDPRGDLESLSCEAVLPRPAELWHRLDPFSRI